MAQALTPNNGVAEEQQVSPTFTTKALAAERAAKATEAGEARDHVSELNEKKTGEVKKASPSPGGRELYSIHGEQVRHAAC